MLIYCGKLFKSVIYFCSKIDHRTYGVMANKPILYGDETSPPVRFVMMAASVLGVDVDFHKIDLFCGENKSEFFTKINTLQKVPVLSVENEYIRDSHAIALYLSRTSNDKVFYPKDILHKAKVDEMLFFNSSSLFPLDSEIFTAFFADQWPVDLQKIEKWNHLLDYLENILCKQKWLAGKKTTLCDLSCAATVSSLRLLLPPLERHSKVNEWLENLNAFPCFDINTKGLERLKSFIDKKKPN